MDQIAWQMRINGYIQQIENSVLLSVRENFRAARVEITVYQTHVKWMCTYVPASGPPKTFQPQQAAQQAYLDLHAWFGKTGKGAWSRSLFTMEGGQTKMQYFYEGDLEGRAAPPIPPALADPDRSGSGPADGP